MTKHGFRRRFVRATMALAVGGSAFQLSGCDPEVRDTVLTGVEGSLQGLTATFIAAYFQTLQEDGSSGAGLTTTSKGF